MVTDKERRTTEYDSYKDFQRQGYDNDNDPCKNLKNKIDYHKELNKRRKQWDRNWPISKYPGGRHKNDIARDTENIKRWEEQYREMCNDSCD